MRALLFFLVSICSLSTTAFSQGLQQAKPWMGVMIETVPGEGVAVKDVVNATPAFKAGIKAGDLIKKLDKEVLTDAKQMILYVQSRGVGNEVKVEYVRAGKTETLTLQLEAKPDELEMIRKTLLGKKIEDFSLENINGEPAYTNKNMDGRVTIVEFWATWCPACRDSHARLSSFAKDQPGIEVLAVSDEEPALLSAYASKLKPNFRIVRDPGGKFSRGFLVSAIPMTVVADKTGTISFATLGAGSYLEEALAHAKDLANKK